MNESYSHNGLSKVIAQFNAAMSNAHLYSETHPLVKESIRKAYVMLIELLDLEPGITMLLVGENLVVNNRPFRSGAPHIQGFINTLKEREIGRITFLIGITEVELYDLIRSLAHQNTEGIRSGNHLKIGKVDICDSSVENLSTPCKQEIEVNPVHDLTAGEIEKIKDICSKAKGTTGINLKDIARSVQNFVIELQRSDNPLALLSSVKSADEYTFTHIVNVAILTISQAESLGISGDLLHRIGVAAMLHDVGKIFIPNEILNKPGKLDSEERLVIESHAIKGARYLLELEGVPKLVILAALEHHIRYDGTGYPLIKEGWRPTLASQLIAIADVFDALRGTRPYRGAMAPERVVQILKKESGTSFNPNLVKNFIKLLAR
ncbi:MAG: HD domain-containing phosphohydrolase [Pseudomonadota bacterium]